MNTMEGQHILPELEERDTVETQTNRERNWNGRLTNFSPSNVNKVMF